MTHNNVITHNSIITHNNIKYCRRVRMLHVHVVCVQGRDEVLGTKCARALRYIVS